jgi:hypothetical protein
MTDTLGTWFRLILIVAVIVVDAVFQEAVILAAEFMMLVRWTRDVVRYDLRWTNQEKNASGLAPTRSLMRI